MAVHKNPLATLAIIAEHVKDHKGQSSVSYQKGTMIALNTKQTSYLPFGEVSLLRSPLDSDMISAKSTVHTVVGLCNLGVDGVHVLAVAGSRMALFRKNPVTPY